MDRQAHRPPAPAAPSAQVSPAVVDGALNEINMNIRGDKVHLEGLLDYNGVLDLEAKLAALKLLLPRPKSAGGEVGDEKPN